MNFKYIYDFATKAEHDNVRSGMTYEEPWVAYSEDVEEVSYNKSWPEKPLTFECLSGATQFSFEDFEGDLSYSLDDGVTWNELSDSVTVTERMQLKGQLTSIDISSGGWVHTDKPFNVMGNIHSVLFGDNFVQEKSLAGKPGCFANMFYGAKVVSARNLVLPATTLANSCYQQMFSGCQSLKIPPKLPATTLASNCYSYMFYFCSSLRRAPELPATTLAEYCYQSMFHKCTSLTSAPKLPATTLTPNCYDSMFRDCASLVIAPEMLPIALAPNCCSSMFLNCTSLRSAPELPATTLASSCYSAMFMDCTSLMTAPVLPAITLVSSCYGSMFTRCYRLNYIKAMFTTEPSEIYTANWVGNVASSGTFVKNNAATWDVTGVNGVPSGWTIETSN